MILATSDHHAESRARSPDQSVADKVAGVNFQRLCACRWDEGRSSGSRMMEPITSNYPGGRHLCEDATQESTKCLEVTFFVAQVSMFRWAAMTAMITPTLTLILRVCAAFSCLGSLPGGCVPPDQLTDLLFFNPHLRESQRSCNGDSF